MHKNLLLAVLLLGTATLSAQVCGSSHSQIDLHGNNIQARILNAGDLFWDLSEGKFIPNPSPNGHRPSTFLAAGLWLGGVDPAGNLQLAASTYRNSGRTDFFPGPLQSDGTADAAACSHWDFHFIVRGERTYAFLAALPALVNDPEQAKAQFRDIMGWPGVGNPFFADIWNFELPSNAQGLAPFHDADEDGIYNPLHGDYPVVSLQNCASFVPTEMVWCVFNDQGAGTIHSNSGGKSLNVEVQLTAWAYTDTINPALDNTVFTSHKLIFRNPEIIDSCYVGIWADFDIGCPYDDYVGTAPALNSIYAYNQDAVDGSTGNTCTGTSTFSGIPPVQSVTFLNVSLDKSMVNVVTSPGGNTGPTQAGEYYNYLTGHWRDGSPLTYGGTGYQSGGAETDHIFPDDPAASTGWSMCTANIPVGDRRMVGSHKFGRVLPGEIREFNLAWTVHANPNLPCGLGSTFDDIAFIRHVYEDSFDCGASIATTTPLDAPVTLSPNPAIHAVALQYGDLPVLEMRCFDAAGRLVRTVRGLPGQQYSLDIADWRSGTYVLQLLTPAGSVTRRLVVLR